MKKRQVKTTFSVHEVVHLTGFSKYMLDYLDRDEIFVASVPRACVRGLRRQYTYADVVLLKGLHAICQGRGKVRFLKEDLMRFRNEFGPLRPGMQVDKKLFVLGDRLHVLTEVEGGRALQDGQLTLTLVVDLPKLSKQIACQILPGPTPESFELTPEATAAAEVIRQRIWSPIRDRRASA